MNLEVYVSTDTDNLRLVKSSIRASVSMWVLNFIKVEVNWKVRDRSPVVGERPMELCMFVAPEPKTTTHTSSYWEHLSFPKIQGGSGV